MSIMPDRARFLPLPGPLALVRLELEREVRNLQMKAVTRGMPPEPPLESFTIAELFGMRDAMRRRLYGSSLALGRAR